MKSYGLIFSTFLIFIFLWGAILSRMKKNYFILTSHHLEAMNLHKLHKVLIDSTPLSSILWPVKNQNNHKTRTNISRKMNISVNFSKTRVYYQLTHEEAILEIGTSNVINARLVSFHISCIAYSLNYKNFEENITCN